MKKQLLFLLAVMVVLQVGAQTEVGGQGLPSGDDQLRKDVEQSWASDMQSQLSRDSLSLAVPPVPPSLSNMNTQGIINSKGFTEQLSQGGTAFRLWKGAYVGFYGSNYHLPGLMNTTTGTMAFHQDYGRWHFTASAEANKYWMPWQRSLSTQYGFGGMVGYDLSDAISLHAFGYYYANQMLVGPAMSPYMNNTTFGGFADVRFSSLFGSKLGVRRYVNPMSGKWETEPIINPYIKLGNGKIELPLGALLKAFVWGDRDNPMRYQSGGMPSQPMSQPSRPPVVRPPGR